jgi:hypothetical protein
MLASFPASMVNQNRSDLGILNRFNITPSRSRVRFFDHEAGTASSTDRSSLHGPDSGARPFMAALAPKRASEG